MLPSTAILLTVPGVDGSVDGHEDKYARIAEAAQHEYGAAAVRMANPFISTFFWESNLREALHYVQENAEAICGTAEFELRIMAHSAGAAIAGRIAWEYPFITHLLLVNPAANLGFEQIRDGLDKFQGNTTILVGSEDPNLAGTTQLGTLADINIIDGADHDFSGPHFDTFLSAPGKYLF